MQARGGQLQCAGQFAVIGEQEEAFGRQVETTDGDDAGQGARQFVENGAPALGIGVRGDQARGLVIAPEASGVRGGNGAAADADQFLACDLEGRRRELLAVDADLAFLDHALDLAAGGDASAGKVFRNALAFAPVSFFGQAARWGGLAFGGGFAARLVSGLASVPVPRLAFAASGAGTRAARLSTLRHDGFLSMSEARIRYPGLRCKVF